MIDRKIHICGLTATLAICAGAVLYSCNAYIEPELGYGEPPCIELTFDTAGSTRADNGPSAFTEAEKVMNTVDLFFYPQNAADDASPVLVHHIGGTKHDTRHVVSISNEAAKALFGENALVSGGTCRVYAVANVSDYNTVEIADDGTCTVTPLDKESATIADLRKIKAVTETFMTSFDGFAMFTKSESGDVVTLDAVSRKATGKIYLKNLAAKIDLFVQFVPNVSGNDPDSGEGPFEWNVMTDNTGSNGKPTAEVHVVNGVQAVLLEGFDKRVLTDDDYYSVRYGDDYCRTMAHSSEYAEYPWAMNLPYYTYPNNWEITPLEKHRTTLLLKVDWIRKDDTYDGKELTTYYSVPVNLDGNQVESNKYYRVKVKINTLGGMNFGEPLELEASWEVLDWGHADLEADIRELRYLQVTQKQFDRDGSVYTAVINGNDGLVTIPFKSSHAAKIKSVTIEYTEFTSFDSNGSSRDLHVIAPGNFESEDHTAYFAQSYEDLMTNDWHCAYIDNVTHNLTVKHKIGLTVQDGTHYVPNTSLKYQYISYLIKIKLEHEDFDLESDEITIMHHPSVYIEGEVNAGINDDSFNGAADGDEARMDRYVEWSFVIPAQHHFGWVRVNSNRYNANNYGGVRGIVKANAAPANWFDSSSDNPVMYIINVTQLEEGSQFHIRDPRVTTNEAANLGISQTSAPHYENGKFTTTGNTHTLTYYYPTDGSMVQESMYAVSPRFRISSAFGISDNEVTLDNAKRRCATYCEYGYPAGRWRLPTVGEMKFVQMLSNSGVVPRIFNKETDYVAAQGIYRFDDNGNESTNGSDGWVRCVYDDWYWVREDGTPDNIRPKLSNAAKNQYDFSDNIYNGGQVFVWGDKEKKSPQKQ